MILTWLLQFRILDWFLVRMQIMDNNESNTAEKRTDKQRVQSVVRQRDGKRPHKGGDELGASGGKISTDSLESEGECLCL